MSDKSFYFTLPAPQGAPASTTRVESRGPVVILGANGSSKIRLGSWLELQSEHKEQVHKISVQKTLSMPSISASMFVDEAEANLIYGWSAAGSIIFTRWMLSFSLSLGFKISQHEKANSCFLLSRKKVAPAGAPRVRLFVI